MLRGRLLLRDRVRGSFFFFLSFFFSFLLTGRENEKKTDSFWILSLFLLRQQQVQVQGDVRCDVLKSRNKEEAEISFFMSFYLSQKKKGGRRENKARLFSFKTLSFFLKHSFSPRGDVATCASTS